MRFGRSFGRHGTGTAQFVQGDGRRHRRVEGVGGDRDVRDVIRLRDDLVGESVAFGPDQDRRADGAGGSIYAPGSPSAIERFAGVGHERDLDDPEGLVARRARGESRTPRPSMRGPLWVYTGPPCPEPNATEEAPNAWALRSTAPTFPGSWTPWRYTHSGPTGAGAHRSSYTASARVPELSPDA